MGLKMLSSQVFIGMVIGLVLASSIGCDQESKPSPSSRPSDLPGATRLSGGCGATPIYQGGIPAWLEEAGAHNNPGQTPYVVASPEVAAGFLFANPLRAGKPENPANKILWVTRTVNRGALSVVAHPIGSSSPVVNAEAMPASPGYIYPSIIDVPSAGCWRISLSWEGNHADLDLQYQ
jgi:hypothetical protein